MNIFEHKKQADPTVSTISDNGVHHVTKSTETSSVQSQALFTAGAIAAFSRQ